MEAKPIPYYFTDGDYWMVRAVAKAPLTIGEMVEGRNGFGGVVAAFLLGGKNCRCGLLSRGNYTEVQKRPWPGRKIPDRQGRDPGFCGNADYFGRSLR